jgi:hypothetical protein
MSVATVQPPVSQFLAHQPPTVNVQPPVIVQQIEMPLAAKAQQNTKTYGTSLQHLKVERLSFWLNDYPDQDITSYLLNDFQNGFPLFLKNLKSVMM